MIQLSEQDDPNALAIFNEKLAFYINESERLAAELAIANRELAVQNQETKKRGG